MAYALLFMITSAFLMSFFSMYINMVLSLSLTVVFKQIHDFLLSSGALMYFMLNLISEYAYLKGVEYKPKTRLGEHLEIICSKRSVDF